MTEEPSQTPLPSGPSSLCFNKEDFTKDDFDVDQFVMGCRRRVQLETLRDDLHIYLKVLKSAMIELINKDYADFVNLSTNLVGMDRAISNLSTPLSQFKDEVLVVRSSMDEAIKDVEGKLHRRKQLGEKKAYLHRLSNIIQSVEKIEKLLGINKYQESTEKPSSSEQSGQLIERVATEFNKLQFYVNKSRDSALVEDIKPRIANITTTLQYSLEASFLESLDSGDSERLEQCLRTYATIDKMAEPESLFRKHVVKPYMEEVITEQYINSNPTGLKGMYNKVLAFIPSHCKRLQEVTTGSLSGATVVRGYDFLVNAVWSEVASSIELRTPHLYAPGNPNSFHEKYLTTMEFVYKFERCCSSQASVKRLRAHLSFNTFMSKWSLPVYFQIRFHEIAGSLESALMTSWDRQGDSEFNLHSTSTLWTSLNKCWSDGVYLKPLCHRFWRLNLQLLARYTTWVLEVRQSALKPKESSADKTGLRSTSSSPDLTKQSDAIVTQSSHMTTSVTQSNGVIDPPVDMAQLVKVIADVQYLVYKFPSYIEQVLRPKLLEVGHEDMSIIQNSLSETEEALKAHLPSFGAYIIDEITQQCSVHLRSVNDIPRLFRKTNREVPSKPSNYLTHLLKPLSSFLEEHKAVVPAPCKEYWTQSVIKNLTEQYLSITNDVLTSVKKMEDSLKRLKRGKATSTSQGMSDDDKIRLQLLLDVKSFGTQITTLEVQNNKVCTYRALLELVDNAKTANSAI